MMTRKIKIYLCLPFLFHLFSQKAEAMIDYSADTLVRSFPLGGYVKGLFGKSFLLWKKKHPKIPIFYGFIRPSLGLKSSAIVNGAIAQIDIYPISILGLYTGKELVLRNTTKLDTFDCDTTLCNGQINRDYWGFRMAIGYKDFFFVSDYKQNVLEVKDSTKMFADEITTLLGSPGRDVGSTHIMMLGHKINNKIQVGLLNMSNKMYHSKNKSQMSMAIVQFKRNKWSYTLGSGIFNTREDQNVFSILGLFQWKGKKGHLLF